ncbi:hypothetical protein NQZ68_029383 [Dissostichus eleginoides]|nr:hypothetical protein NQZ68_029383 [Dissostichus eleginoides]
MNCGIQRSVAIWKRSDRKSHTKTNPPVGRETGLNGAKPQLSGPDSVQDGAGQRPPLNRLPRASLETRQSSREDSPGADLQATLASNVDAKKRTRRGDARQLKLE